MKEATQSPLRVFEGLRQEVMTLFDQVEELGALVSLFVAFGLLLLAIAGLTDVPYRRLLALGGLIFVGMNAALLGISAMRARRQVRRLLADPRPFQRLGELMVSLLSLTIHLQEISLSLFQYAHKNSGAFLKNLHAFRFIPGMNYLSNMGPEQIHQISALLVEVTEGWRTVFSLIQQEVEHTAPIDLAGHQKTMHKLQTVLAPVNEVFGQLMQEVDQLLNSAQDEESAAHVERIITELETLHATLADLPASLFPTVG